MRADVSITKKSTKIMLLASTYGALFLFIASTSPRDLSAFLLIMPVVLLFIALFLSTYWFVLGKSVETNIRKVVISAIIAGVPSIVLLLRSMGQLTPKDVFLMVVFAIVVYVYADRITFSNKRQM